MDRNNNNKKTTNQAIKQQDKNKQTNGSDRYTRCS